MYNYTYEKSNFLLKVFTIELSWAIGVAYPTAYRMSTIMRKVAVCTKLSGEVEIEDTYYGGKRGRGTA